jgi:serine/threonine protein kinase
MRSRHILVTTQLAHKAHAIQQKEGFVAGEKFENLTIIAPLSINRFLHVYVAEKEAEKVVLKILILPNDMPIKGKNYYRRLFNQEFELITEVGKHEHICQLREWYSAKNYAILEYIEGQSLRKLAESGVSNLVDRLHIFGQILKAVAVLHQKKILHGDIHASNFLIHKEGSVRLIDFDLANREHLHRHEILHEGGVHEYIAPEKIDDNSFEMVKERSDYHSEVYQLGIILYYLLYQQLPFLALSWQELVPKILHDEPKYPLIINTGEELDAFVISFLKKCISKNPKNRFTSASEASIAWQYFTNTLTRVQNPR